MVDVCDLEVMHETLGYFLKWRREELEKLEESSSGAEKE
jgi:hypothetical protein